MDDSIRLGQATYLYARAARASRRSPARPTDGEPRTLLARSRRRSSMILVLVLLLPSATAAVCSAPTCLCEDSCRFSRDGECDDSGPGALNVRYTTAGDLALSPSKRAQP